MCLELNCLLLSERVFQSLLGECEGISLHLSLFSYFIKFSFLCCYLTTSLISQECRPCWYIFSNTRPCCCNLPHCCLLKLVFSSVPCWFWQESVLDGHFSSQERLTTFVYHFSKVVNFYSGYEAWIKDLIATRFIFLALSLMISLCKSLSFPLCLSCVSHLPLKDRDTYWSPYAIKAADIGAKHVCWWHRAAVHSQ